MNTRTEIRDLTTGSVARKLYSFALPIICINLLQAIYNLVDMIIVGRTLGSVGITAVNVSGQIVMLIFSVVNALAIAESILVGQLVGANKQEEIPKVVNSIMIFSLIIATALIIAIIGFSGPLLHAINVPEEAFSATRTYLIVYMCGTYFVYIYNILYGLLRGIGNSASSMIFAMISTGVNIVLDVLFVIVLSLGVGGAALATIMAQALSMGLIMLFIDKKISVYSFARKEFRIAKKWLQENLKVGFPQMCQFILTNLSFILITSLVNGFGLQASAAVGAINKIYTFSVLTGQAMMSAIVTMTAQNLPNKNYIRIRKGLGFGILLSVLIGFFIFIISEIFPAQLMSIFTLEEGVFDVGIPFMRIFMWVVLIENVMLCFNGHLAGAGYTHITMIAALTAAFIFRIGFAYLLSQLTPLGFNGIAVAYIIAPSYQLVFLGLFTLSGRWKKLRVKIQSDNKPGAEKLLEG